MRAVKAFVPADTGRAKLQRKARLHPSPEERVAGKSAVRDSIGAPKGTQDLKASVSQTNIQVQKLVSDGAARLLARAANARALGVEVLAPRVRSALDKYLLSNSENASAQAINEFMDGLHADDLCLIVACERGDQQAWSDLVAQFGTTVRSAARSASSNEDAAEDLAQSIWAELHGLRVREDGRPSGKLAYYSGRGSLGGWLRAVVGQLAIDQHRKSSRLVQTELDTDFDRLARDSHQAEGSVSVTMSAPDPETVLSEQRASADVEEALAQSLRELAQHASEHLAVEIENLHGVGGALIVIVKILDEF